MTSKKYYEWVSHELTTNKNGDNNVDLMNYSTGAFNIKRAIVEESNDK